MPDEENTYRIILRDRASTCERFLSASEDCSIDSVGFVISDKGGLQRWVFTKAGPGDISTPSPSPLPPSLSPSPVPPTVSPPPQSTPNPVPTPTATAPSFDENDTPAPTDPIQTDPPTPVPPVFFGGTDPPIVITDAPDPVEAVYPTLPCGDIVKVSWEAPPVGYVEKYSVECVPDSGSPIRLLEISNSLNTIEIGPLVPGREYQCSVAASNAAGTSQPGRTSAFRTG